MFRIFDITTSDILDYEDVDDFKAAKEGWDESVHEAIDEMCDSYKRGDYIGEYEAFLGIKVITDMTLDVYDLIDLYR
jgi:hypothetical protein